MKKIYILKIFLLLGILFPSFALAELPTQSCQWIHTYSSDDPCLGAPANITKANDSYCTATKPTDGAYACCCPYNTVRPAETFGSSKPNFIMPELQITIPVLKLTASSSIEGGINEDGSSYISVPWISEYLLALYNYGLSITGILAALVLMAGGVLWLISAGDASKITQSKELISGSLTGMLILFCSYIILYQINPALTTFKSIDMGLIDNIAVKNEVSEGVSTPFFQCLYTEYGSNEQAVNISLTTVNFLGMNYRVHNKMATALENAQQQITSAGITYKSSDKAGGGFNWRTNRNNPNQQSLHSFGIAIDINPTNNPNYRSKVRPCKTDIPQKVIDILKNNGFRWGGEYKSVCDSMHFEWVRGSASCKIN